jgi:hypothetical protein
MEQPMPLQIVLKLQLKWNLFENHTNNMKKDKQLNNLPPPTSSNHPSRDPCHHLRNCDHNLYHRRILHHNCHHSHHHNRHHYCYQLRQTSVTDYTSCPSCIVPLHQCERPCEQNSQLAHVSSRRVRTCGESNRCFAGWLPACSAWRTGQADHRGEERVESVVDLADAGVGYVEAPR